MDYKEAKDFLSNLLDRERAIRPSYPHSLKEYRDFLKKMGDPHKGLKCILVAGTKGKGSTAFLISRILTGLGYRTGLYTSPHLVEVRERIRLNGQCIEEEEFGRLMERIAPNVETVGFRSVFETLTTLAFFYFQEKRIDWAVFEIGLGGRLDATNVVEPKVSVLTDISYDHTHVLGKTLMEITREKLGISRQGIPLVSQVQNGRIRNYIKKYYKGKVFFTGIDEKVKVLDNTMDGVRFFYRDEEFFLPMPGRHQAMNAATAIEAVIKTGEVVDFDKIKEILKTAIWHGRFQFISREPPIVLDGAHNTKSVKVLVDTWREIFRVNDRPNVLFTALKRKPIGEMLKLLKEISSNFVFTTLPIKRAISLDALESIARKNNIKYTGFENVVDAWKFVKGENKPILVTGSLYLVGKIMEIENIDPCKYN